MIRRCVCSLIPLVEARNLFFNELGRPLPQPAAPLPRVLEALGEHYAPSSGGEAFVEAALNHVTQLDRTDEDSRQIATWYRGSTPSSPSGVEGGRMVLALMRAYPHNVLVREGGCRCLANISQLSAPPLGEDGLAESLVREGAVEEALGTAAMAVRLSGRGRSQVALAVLNLICLSRTGVARAATAGGESILSDFLFTVMETGDRDSEAARARSTHEKYPVQEGGDAGLVGLGRERCIALDAALGALAGVLAAEASENAQGISYNYEKVGYATVDAIVRTLLMSSSLLCHIARNDGNICASFPPQRCIAVRFSELSSHRRTAIVMLLPLLHKGWMTLCDICSRGENIPMVCESLCTASSVSEGEESRDYGNLAEGNRELLEPLSGNAVVRQHVAPLLSHVVEAARFLVSELEGLQDMGDAGMSTLQRELRESVMACMDRLTATRTDVPIERLQHSAITASGAAVVNDDMDGVSVVLPIPAVRSVMEVLVSGDLSYMALATAVRLHTHLRHASHGDVVCSAGSEDLPCLLPWDADDFRLLCRSISVLSHLARTDDEGARSANTLASLQVMLRGALDGMNAVASWNPHGDGTREIFLAEFFRTPIEAVGESHGAGDEVDGEGRMSGLQLRSDERETASLRLFFTQQITLVGQLYAVLSGVLQAPGGVRTLAELNVMDTVKGVQRCLNRVDASGMRRGKELGGGDSMTSSSFEEAEPPTAAAEENAHGVANGEGMPSGVENSVHHLMKFGGRLIWYFETVNQPPAGGVDPVKCEK
ncbi:unnamed protein product [Phytomonas sp. Hart1]|nr:unnamed protein product [Phytomonas sp. Hart1]|eukprot:CCW70718.1 unnamed protein product [Phytomonas sp. isolate Hart1]